MVYQCRMGLALRRPKILGLYVYTSDFLSGDYGFLF